MLFVSWCFDLNLVSLTTRRSNPVRDTLQAFAARGVFREFGETRRGARTEYKFRWLTPAPIHLVHDSRAHTLNFRHLLPNMPAKSDIYRGLRKFLAGRTLASVPEHRRIDPRRTEIKTINRGGSVSILIKFRPRSARYAARKAINIVNEIFMGFLTGPYYDYMVENFAMSEE